MNAIQMFDVGLRTVLTPAGSGPARAFAVRAPPKENEE
jgi:hypothetical protein